MFVVHQEISAVGTNTLPSAAIRESVRWQVSHKETQPHSVGSSSNEALMKDGHGWNRPPHHWEVFVAIVPRLPSSSRLTHCIRWHRPIPVGPLRTGIPGPFKQSVISLLQPTVGKHGRDHIGPTPYG